MSAKIEDDHLLREIGRGSRAAFERFYEKYATFVYRTALRIMHDPAEAEDLCHDVFLEVYRTADQYKEERGSVEAWLAVKTRSRCIDRLRKTKIKAKYAKNLPPAKEMATVEETILTKLERDLVRDVLGGIPEAQRQAVYGFYFQAKTHRELAQAMNRPLGTVKSLVRYGLHNLRKQLVQNGWAGKEGREK
ncbi:sigma-70 family RNA polymerase sigma factor [Brevibacillus composti]|uniref:Sigma-70 family RNA polymerase sigma factor n=1 Tax=Brevibacillus composti TaxID=2796470 RepID=A0A7T5ENZ3_9BACL|nr:sigma-70 family RNA polymerase sigma factor [Brevibacillus composti]QQE76087.1 sigma-70 family RNA polymerase sigma factor [Brevibacillus composti]QUO43115.1 sigma-70 family RNA polymerase sigma factor [Brevibacillus composti]